MPRPQPHQPPVCYCHITKQFYYPAQIAHGMGPCPYCDAYGVTYADPAYRPNAPQWHPLKNAIEVLKTRAPSASAAAQRPHPQRP